MSEMNKHGGHAPNHGEREWENYVDALLADLQNTVPQNSGMSLDRATHQTTQPYSTSQKSRTVTVTTEQHSEIPKGSNLNSNLSELDMLLQELHSARYSTTGYTERTDGSSNMNGDLSQHQSYNDPQPSLDGLLNDLKSGSMRSGEISETTTTTTTTNAASSATRELDDLMTSLSGFKLKEQQAHRLENVPPPLTPVPQDNLYAKPNKPKGELDSMLGNLHEDMSKQGVTTTQKGCCAACQKPIVGQVVTALGKTWHLEHFTCAHCERELGTQNFFERDGQPYCEADYHNLFSPRCAYCNGPILNKCVTALEKTWHPEHFFCATCGNPFGEDGFHEKDGLAYCRDDYFASFAPKCAGCNRAITDNYISALNSQWHTDCFVCKDCHMPLPGGQFFDFEGWPYCETHYHAKRGSLCAGCHKPISGRCITAMGRKYHPEHFQCSFCMQQLNKGTFKEQTDKAYCHHCFEKLFG